jgi:hypothetical protein
MRFISRRVLRRTYSSILIIKKRCEEGDQESILFVDMLNQVVDFNSFMEMMANMVK